MKSQVGRRWLSIVLTLILGISLAGASHAATPKAGGPCTKAGLAVVSGGKKFTCVKSGKKLIWDKGLVITPVAAPTPTPSPTPVAAPTPTPSPTTTSYSSPSATPTPSASASGGGNNNSNNNQQQSSTFALGQLGATCSKEGELGWNGLLVGVCKSGKVRYALAADIPTTPTGGYKTRPTWYPTLTQVLGGSNATEPSCAPSSIKFTKPVIPLDKMAASIPYGMMVSGHVTPIDHGYLGLTSLAISPANRTESDWVPVTAPADGTITELSSLGSPNTSRVVINHGCNLYSVYMVLNKPSGVLANYVSELASKGSISLSIKVKAGDEFGRQRDNMLDFNVFDGTQWLSGFANPQAYLSQETWKPYTADFLPFFSDEIRSGIEKWMQKTTSPRVGKIDWDVVGTASGNWFIDGTNGYGGNQNSLYEKATSPIGGGFVEGKNDYSWGHLAIAPHEVDNSQWIFSTGWWSDPKGDATQLLMVIGSGQVAPDKLTAASGAVTYQLAQISYEEPAGSPARIPGSTAPWAVGYKVTGGSIRGSVTLQVNSDGSLSVEIGATGKRIYRR
ncbi:MAG: hypothetical protein KGP06_03680 [Acidobacteria bacterium]|nr:hypothetical protein [Acidobacteriota bacterium]